MNRKEMMNRKTGVIRNLRVEGYGFIDSGSSSNIFFHRSNLIGVSFSSLKVGTMVEFDVREAIKGTVAEKIIVVADPD